MCFVDLEKAFDRVPRGILWEVLREYRVGGPLLRAVGSLYDQSRSLVHIAGSKSDLFPVRVGLQQGCPLSCCNIHTKIYFTLWKISICPKHNFFIPGTVGGHSFRPWVLMMSYWSLYYVSFTFSLVSLHVSHSCSTIVGSFVTPDHNFLPCFPTFVCWMYSINRSLDPVCNPPDYFLKPYHSAVNSLPT